METISETDCSEATSARAACQGADDETEVKYGVSFEKLVELRIREAMDTGPPSQRRRRDRL